MTEKLTSTEHGEKEKETEKNLGDKENPVGK